MRRATLIALAVLVIAEMLLGSVLYQNYTHEVQQRLVFRSNQLHRDFQGTVDSYRQMVEAIFRQAIERPEIVDLIAAANTADRDTARRLRGRLYRDLSPVYALLRERNVRVLQFVLADGTSFVRFNRPDLYGDDIATDRPLLRKVLESGRPGQAFENGRVYPGFRYAFPLFKDGRVVGVADFSAAFDALHRVLISRIGAEEAFKRLLIRRDLLTAVAHPSALSLFRDSPIHQALVIEDDASSLRHLSWMPDVPAFAGPLDRAIGENRAFRALIDAGRGASIHQCLQAGNCFTASLEPVPDSIGRPAGYIVSYRPDAELLPIRNQHLLMFAIGSALLLGGVSAFRRWLASRQRLQTISENMAEGMYVMDVRGKILYANKAANELLGYDAGELVGQPAHELFHVHSGDRVVSGSECPIRIFPLKGETYKGDNELFRRKDGRDLRVSVTSSPLREEGEISGSIVLFRDVTAEHSAQVRLRQTDAAFRNLAEAVFVTDAAANIQAVNEAFTAITGYSEDEVRGRNPRLLASGRHDSDFYRQMWGAVATTGAWQGEIWNRRKNGEVFPEWLNITAIRDDQGEVSSYVSVFSDITEVQRKEARLRDLAFHDQLTGLPNRAYFQELSQLAVHRARRHGSFFALLYLDLDRFKYINDTLGHLVGDQLLQTVATRITRAVRERDVVARIGGDELIVLIEDVTHNEAPARVARKLLHGLSQPIGVEQKQLYVTASIGISLFPQDGDDTVTLLKNADAAMYLAKQRGRNNYEYFTASMAREAEDRFALEHDLRGALRDDQFVLHYQPKVQAADGRIVGVEALLRWRHPQRGLLAPVAFLDVAADAGLLSDITEWVVRNVARQLVEWGSAPGRVAVNLDDQTLQGADAPQRLELWVREEGAEPGQLELEITETVVLRRGELQPLWQELVDAGFELSLDDFGTGESSLFRLKLLPVRTLKVDKAFVDEIDHQEPDRAVLRSIVCMAKSLGKQVLAEGVERAEQLEVLQEIGCDQVQGYFFGKPMPPAALRDWLRASASAPPILPEERDRNADSVLKFERRERGAG